MATLLVVDDSAVDRSLVGGLLENNLAYRVLYASDGEQALAEIERHSPDLIITDLQMPGIDGLELTTVIRGRFPEVPVVLITAHGSESLALEALERGASSYVPKSQLNEKLLDTVEQILSLVRADASLSRLAQCLTRAECEFDLPCETGLIDSMVDLVQQSIALVGLCDTTGRVRVGVAVEEALLNALYRGNLEVSFQQMQEARESLLEGGGVTLLDRRRGEPPFCNRQIHVRVSVSPEEARFTIRDEGPGFDVAALPEPGNPEAIEREGGRGLVLMRHFMDDVRFNDLGNEVTMTKRRDVAVSHAGNGQPH